MDNVKQKLILIIGGTGGIGSETAKSFLAQGDRVCITYNENQEKAKEIISQDPNNCFAYQMDLRQPNSTTSVLENIRSNRGNIDIIIFAPTIQTMPKHFADKEWSSFQENIDVQIKGFYSIVKNVMPQIKSGHKIKFIVLLTDYCLGTPPAGLSDYITAKYGLMGLAKSLSIELARYGCTINMVSPGMTDTKLLSNVPPKLMEITAMKNPLKRIAISKDVANVILFLASTKADYLNGVNTPVNGGGIIN